MKKVLSHKAFLFSIFSACVLILFLLFYQNSLWKSSSTGTASEFHTYTTNLFLQNIVSSTIDLHYVLADPASYGITDYPITFGELSQDSNTKAYAQTENMKKTLSCFSHTTFSQKDQITYDILLDYVDCALANPTDYFYYEEPLRSSTGIQAELPILLAEYSFRNKTDIEDYLSLLSIMDNYYTQIADFEISKSKSGLFMADFAAQNIIKQCQDFCDDPQNHYLLTTFSTKIQNCTFISEKEREEYIAQNQKLLTEHVIPAYELLEEKMSSLLGTGTNNLGLCYYPSGRNYYTNLVHGYTGTDCTIPLLKDKTAAKREQDFLAISKLLEKDPSLATACTSYSFDDNDPSAMLELLKEKMLTDFPAPADTTFTIKYVDDALCEYLAPAFYLTAPIDDISTNCIYINPKSDYRKIKLFTTLAHEGYPGHMYQTIMTSSYGISPVRNLLNYPGFTEGWATYIEMISYQYAGLDADLASLLQLNQSAILSLYATADMGIHYEGWNLDDTIRFFNAYGFNDSTVIQDIQQLIIEEPGHYLKYYIGYLEFLDLQAQAKDVMGNQYSNTAFHKAILEIGPAPFPIVEKYLPAYLED